MLGKIFSSARPKNLRSPRSSWRGLASLGGRLNRPSGDPAATPTSLRESLQPSPEFKGAQGLAKCASFLFHTFPCSRKASRSAPTPKQLRFLLASSSLALASCVHRVISDDKAKEKGSKGSGEGGGGGGGGPVGQVRQLL